MAEETWMNDKEAVENGFATSTGSKNSVKNTFDLSEFKFKHVPKELQSDEEKKLKADIADSKQKIEQLQEEIARVETLPIESPEFDSVDLRLRQLQLAKLK
jgi:hypothetical protein